ncbi:kinase-like domain-containing protein [Trichoderma ceciliae]
MTEEQSSLKKKLRKALVPNPCDRGRRFMPCRQLETICNVQTVAKELARTFPQQDHDSCQKRASLICHGQAQDTSVIYKPCLKIFAILVLLRKVNMIESFQKHPLCDDDLPFFSTSDFTKLWSHKKGREDYLEFPDEDEYDDAIEGFIDKQWSFLAPSFDAPTTGSMRCNVYEFDEKTILPIESVSKKKYPGGFGLVEKVKLHDEHNSFKHKLFALKTMHPLMPDERERFFRQELEAFHKAKPGGHLIEICAAFKKGESCSFLFPWADGGTLNHLWADQPHKLVATRGVEWSQFSRWICIQCHGIVRDLRAIHEPYDKYQNKEKNDVEDLFGIHSDIKPDNILHFSKDGLPFGSLKVSDLGLMRFHRLISRTVQSKSMGNAYQTYRAPEHDMGKVRSRKIDIWAFGCLFAEFLTWAICGKNGIETFKTRRINEDKRFPDENKGEWSEDNFFIMKTKGPKRKSSVDEWFTGLIEHLGPGTLNTFFPQFLRFIQLSMLHPDRDARAECQKVEDFLERCLKNTAHSSFWRFNGTVLDQNSYSRSTTENSTW